MKNYYMYLARSFLAFLSISFLDTAFCKLSLTHFIKNLDTELIMANYYRTQIFPEKIVVGLVGKKFFF